MVRKVQSFDLDHPLVKFSNDKKDWWTIRDAVRGTQIFGGIGSGKSSGSGKTIAKAFLKNGFGGLVLCAKPDERENWERYAAETGRTNDLIIFSEDSAFEFNPLQYEQTRPGKGAGEVFNLVNLFMEIYKMGNRFGGGGGAAEKDRFWDNALKRCITSMIQLLQFADQEVSIANMRRLLSSAPMEDELDELSKLSEEEFKEAAADNFCLSALGIAESKERSEQETEEYGYIHDYFLREFANFPDKTRSIIVESFMGLAVPFTSGILRKHFSGATNLTPELTHEGKIIILDFPVKEYLTAGVYAQGIFKLLWQQATERRDISKHPTPVFLWVDEAQLFLSEYDQIFQTTARSSRACTVFLSQNLSNYYVAIGGSNPRPKADSLLGNLSTKIYHANNDSVTNQWAAETIGKATMHLSGVSIGKHDSTTLNQHINYQIEPREFTMLKSGGKDNNFEVEGIMTLAGRRWSNERNFYQVIFPQR